VHRQYYRLFASKYIHVPGKEQPREKRENRGWRLHCIRGLFNINVLESKCAASLGINHQIPVSRITRLELMRSSLDVLPEDIWNHVLGFVRVESSLDAVESHLYGAGGIIRGCAAILNLLTVDKALAVSVSQCFADTTLTAF
jgi:hypothetical protein